MKMSRRLLGLAAGAALVAATLPAGAVAATKSTAYFAFGDGSSTAYLIDWLPKGKARVAARLGAQAGTVGDDGTQKKITFGTPLSESSDTFDECGQPIQLRRDVQQLVVRDLAGGTTQFVELGVYVNVGGCQDGLTSPFGSPTDEGLGLKRLPMTARPSVADLVPGTQVAGFSEDVMLPGENGFAEDVVTLQAGSAQFQRSGNVVPAGFDANQWLVFSFPGFQRAYTRVAVDAKTGGETWLMADWAGGQAQRIEERLLVKPAAGAGFGSVAQAARVWESGLFVNSPRPFFFHFYKNGTGERVSKDLDLGTESRSPITAWGFDGLNLVQTRPFGGGTGERTWVPLRNQGKIRWVMETEVVAPNGMEPFTLIKPRVNFYEDTGKAVPPAQLGRGQGMVYLNAKPQQPR
jgi:hypothetical protein